MTAGAGGAPVLELGFCWHKGVVFRLDDPTVQAKCTARTWRAIVRLELRPPAPNPPPEVQRPPLLLIVLGQFYGATADAERARHFRPLWWRWWGQRAALEKAREVRRAQAMPDDRLHELSTRQRSRRIRERPPDEVVASLARVSVSDSPKSSSTLHLERRVRDASELRAAP